jgi:hypothetical protein
MALERSLILVRGRPQGCACPSDRARFALSYPLVLRSSLQNSLTSPQKICLRQIGQQQSVISTRFGGRFTRRA